MREALLSWFTERFGGSDPEQTEPTTDPLALAATALLLEMARMDDHIDDDERARIATLVTWKFNLNPSTAAALIEMAEADSKDRADWYAYTAEIVDRTSPDERIEIVELLWDVAYADGTVHHLEANLVRRIAGLLFVSDKDNGLARQRVERRYSSA